MSKAKCICGHEALMHPPEPHQPPGKVALHCFGGTHRGCPCEGYQRPARSGERLVFGKDRLPRKVAESAPAWPPLRDPS